MPFPALFLGFTNVSDLWRFDVDPDPRIHATGLRIRILLFPSVAVKIPIKKLFLCFCILRIFTPVFKDNKLLRSQNTVETKVFFNFLLVDGRIRIRSKIMTDSDPGPKTYGSYGSWILVYVQRFYAFYLQLLVFLFCTLGDTLSMGGDQSAMEPSWTMVSVMGYGNWDRIVFPANICSSRCKTEMICFGSDSGSRSCFGSGNAGLRLEKVGRGNFTNVFVT